MLGLTLTIGLGLDRFETRRTVCIDDRRACNVNIGLAGIKKSPAEIAAAVTNLDGENLGSDALGRLVKIFPTMEELKKLRRFK
eukprot:58051-Amorphochlora_amoeboformis.AAC.1